MLKLCYKNNDKRTDEYYFDLQSQKVYKICLSTYYAKQNTRGIPFVFISGGCILRSPAVANAFWNGRFAEHNGRPLLVD